MLTWSQWRIGNKPHTVCSTRRSRNGDGDLRGVQGDVQLELGLLRQGSLYGRLCGLPRTVDLRCRLGRDRIQIRCLRQRCQRLTGTQ